MHASNMGLRRRGGVTALAPTPPDAAVRRRRSYSGASLGTAYCLKASFNASAAICCAAMAFSITAPIPKNSWVTPS